MSLGTGLNIHEEVSQALGKNTQIPPIKPKRLTPSGSSVLITKHGREQALGGCNRAEFLRLKGEIRSDPRDNSIESIGAHKIGSLIEEYIREEYLKKAGIFHQSELELHIPKWNVSGRVDNILRKDTVKIDIVEEALDGTSKTKRIPLADVSLGDVIDGIPIKESTFFGLEIKSIANYTDVAKYIKCGVKVAQDSPESFIPSPSHLIQCLIYLYGTKTIKSLQRYNINKWFIKYVDRASGNFNVFDLELTEEGYLKIYSYAVPQGFVYKEFNVQGIIKRWEELLFCFEHNIVPNRDYTLQYSGDKILAMYNNGETFNKYNRDMIKAGRANECVSGKNTDHQRPYGDNKCHFCPWVSKCWGLGDYTESEFTYTHMEPKSLQFSYFDPFASDYFDHLSEDQKTKLRSGINV